MPRKETPEQRKLRLYRERLRREEKKRNETPEEREKRLEKRRSRRLQETPEQRARTAEANRRRYQNFKKKETENEHRTRLDTINERNQLSRELETDEERSIRLQSAALIMRRRRYGESSEERDRRLSLDAERHQQQWASSKKRNETPEEREKRLEKRRLRRLQETPEQRARTAEANTMSKVGVDQDAKLIAAVEHNRCLYDAGDPDYDNEVMKENVWQMIAKSMDVTVDRAKSRWHSLEALYQKSLNSVNKIHLFGKMSFLRPHLNAETREEPKPIDEQSTISIKTEVISSDEEFADTVEATPSNMGAVGLIMVDPYKKSSVPLVTYENQHDRSPLEDLEMKVEEEIEEDEETDEVEEENYDILEEPHNSTSANSSLCHIPPSDTSFTEAKLQEVSESFAKKRKFTKKLLKSEVPKPDQDLEYFKGFMSMIKELNAKRKRQLFASFAQELFRLLEEQELEESESTET